MRGRPVVSVAALASALLHGCVSGSAGVPEARSAVGARAGLELLDGAEDGAEIEHARRAILSAPLTADAAAKLAVLSSPEVQASLQGVGVARGSLVEAMRLPNPELDGAIRFHDGGDPHVDLGASIDVTDFIFLPLRASSASSALDAASLEAAGTAIDVAFEAKIAFYDSQAARQVLDLEKTVAFAMAQSSDVARRLRQAGNVPELDALNEQAIFEESRLGVASAEVDEVVARERLTRTIGLWGADAGRIRVDTRLQDPPDADALALDLERRALEKSLDLEALRLRYAAAAGEIDLSRVEGWTPEIGAGVTAEKEESGWGVGPQIRLGLPLFYQGQGRTDRAIAEQLSLKSRHDATAIRVRESARTLAARLEASRNRALFYQRTLLPLREQIVLETERQYNAMSLGVFQLLAAKVAQVQAARGYVEALRDYWSTRAQVEQLLAGRVPSARATAPAVSVVQGGGSPGH